MRMPSSGLYPIAQKRSGRFGDVWSPTSRASEALHVDGITWPIWIDFRDEYWWWLMTIGDVWWVLMMIDNYWWCLMSIDDVWWVLMMFDKYWRFSMNIDEYWCSMILDDYWCVLFSHFSHFSHFSILRSTHPQRLWDGAGQGGEASDHRKSGGYLPKPKKRNKDNIEITIFNREINYKLPFSIVILCYISLPDGSIEMDVNVRKMMQIVVLRCYMLNSYT